MRINAQDGDYERESLKVCVKCEHRQVCVWVESCKYKLHLYSFTLAAFP